MPSSGIRLAKCKHGFSIYPIMFSLDIRAGRFLHAAKVKETRVEEKISRGGSGSNRRGS
jgi:hypothetical protein